MRFLFPIYGTEFLRGIAELDVHYRSGASNLIFDKGQSWTKFACFPGQRVPNLRLTDGSHLHSHVDRVRHTFVYLNAELPSEIPAGLRAARVSVTPSPAAEQISVPAIADSVLTKPQVILVRRDQFVAGVDKSFDVLWNRMKQAVDEKILLTM